MKFLLIKDLDESGSATPLWIKYHQKRYIENPEKFKGEYVKLVKSIALLHTIEQTLRTQVFGLGSEGSSSTSPQQDLPINWELLPWAPIDTTKKSGSPVGDFSIGVDLMQKLNPLIDLFLEKATTQLLKKI